MYTTIIKRESELPMLNSVESYRSSISYYKIWLKEIYSSHDIEGEPFTTKELS